MKVLKELVLKLIFLIKLIFKTMFGFLEKINPTDTEFVDFLRDIANRLFTLERARQAYFGDWYEFSEELVYFSATEVRTTNPDVDLRKTFVVGDPFRYKQGGDYKYGYITRVDANRMRVRAGSDFTVANATITDVARGLKNNPSGFPFFFNQPNSDYSTPAGSITLSVDPSHTKTQFYMTGPLVTMRVITFFATVSVNGMTVFLNLPAKSIEVTNAFRPNYSDSSGPQWGVVKVTAGTYLEIVPTAAFGGYSNAAGNTNMNFTFDYIVGED